MRPCTLRIASAEEVIKATSLNDSLVEHAPWCRAAPDPLPTHTKPLMAIAEIRAADYPPPFSSSEVIAAPTDAPDERIDVGVLIVGGGPAGLACAIRLGQLLED